MVGWDNVLLLYVTIMICWKCWIELNSYNRSALVYLSNPPKYTCKNCEGEIKSSESQRNPLTKEQEELYAKMASQKKDATVTE